MNWWSASYNAIVNYNLISSKVSAYSACLYKLVTVLCYVDRTIAMRAIVSTIRPVTCRKTPLPLTRLHLKLFLASYPVFVKIVRPSPLATQARPLPERHDNLVKFRTLIPLLTYFPSIPHAPPNKRT